LPVVQVAVQATAVVVEVLVVTEHQPELRAETLLQKILLSLLQRLTTP
jgi:hypothetical protein